jgi:UrcA family protein
MKTSALVLFTALMMSASASMAGDEYSLVYSKQDFRSSETVAALYQRVVKTAQNYCPDYSRTRSLSEHYDCINDVVTDLVQSIDNQTLTAYVQGETNMQIATQDHVGSDRG